MPNGQGRFRIVVGPKLFFLYKIINICSENFLNLFFDSANELTELNGPAYDKLYT